jgi:hypothetical protein
MPNRLAVSANDTPYSLISFNAIALLSFGKEGAATAGLKHGYRYLFIFTTYAGPATGSRNDS